MSISKRLRMVMLVMFVMFVMSLDRYYAGRKGTILVNKTRCARKMNSLL